MKRYLLLFLIMIVFSSDAKRIIRFNNKTNLPNERFTYFFVAWKDIHQKGKVDHNIHKRFSHFPKEIDLDTLKDVHSKKPIPEDTDISIIAKTDYASGLMTKDHPPKPIMLEGTLKNPKPIIYNVIISDYQLKFVPAE
jgi:hypothetical protein